MVNVLEQTMPKQPINGYPSISAAVMAMRAEGWAYPAIDDELGLTKGRAQNLAYLQDKRAAGPIWPIKLESSIAHNFVHAAANRGLTSTDLAVRLLTAITQDDMFNAVLDDDSEGTSS